MKEHKGFTINFGGNQSEIRVCRLAAAKVDPPLFNNLNSGCKPIATKSRLFSKPDKDFIKVEVRKLYAEGVIEPSSSPWRSQVLVTSEGTHKRRMVVDYSQTINKFTELDAYPVPRTSDIANSLTQYKVFSTFDLKVHIIRYSSRMRINCSQHLKQMDNCTSSAECPSALRMQLLVFKES